MTFQFGGASLIICRYADTQKTCRLATTHSQQAMGRTTFQWFREVEIIGEALGFFLVLLLCHHLGGDNGATTELTSYLVAALLILAHRLGNDVLGSLERSLHIAHLVTHKLTGSLLGITFALKQEELCQRFKSLFASHLCTGTALGFKRQIDVFQLCGVPTVVDALLQLCRKLTLIVDGLQNSLLALRHLLIFLVGLSHRLYLHLVHIACFLLTIAGDEGDSTTFLKQL